MALILVLVPLPGAAADSGCGDAPGDPSSACNIPLGLHGGTIGGGDDSDWYRVFIAPGDGIAAQFDIERGSNVHFTAYAENDPFFTYHDMTVGGCCSPPEDPYDHGFHGFLVGGGPVIIGIWSPDPVGGFFNYQLNLQPAQPNDIAITDVRIENVPLQTDLGQGPLGTLKRVEVDLQNLLPSGNHGAGLNVHVHTDDGTYQVGAEGFDIQPGMSRTFTYIWDTLGTVGDVRVHVNTGNPWDTGGQNNDANVYTFVLVGGVGHGVAPTKRDNGGQGIDTCRGYGAENVPWTNVCVSAGTNPGGSGIDAHVSVQIQDAIADLNVFYDPYGGGNADACGWTAPTGGVCQGLPLP